MLSVMCGTAFEVFTELARNDEVMHMARVGTVVLTATRSKNWITLEGAA
jgi:hypothetical protein